MQTGLTRPLVNLEDLNQEFLGASIPELFELLPIGVQIDDAQHRTLYINGRFTEMLGYTLEDIADLDDWFRCCYPDPAEREMVRRDWSEKLAHADATGSEIPVIERRLTCKNGETKVIEFHIRKIGDHYIYLNTDVSVRAHLVAEMHRLAFTDSLTGKGNRRSFLAEGEALLRAGRHPLAGLMLDIDHFKSLNDRFGHKIGDEALVEVASRCHAELQDGQHLARLGGEEFGVLLPGCDRPAAVAIAERLRLAVTERPLVFAELELAVPIGVCVGGAMAAREERSIEGVLSRADRALYEAKRTGRNRVCFAEG
ncbi:MAG TPA: sensor domain-containing diguanylate cyclase [Acidisoma sp.]|uniref:sensor domain-containing diguanylate cyclase n=1 Tax=Acidisoma sp. TaxID=1872115 RepID=UPI002C942FBA|nr:sensor domain-containing diguanylate cyclase [Acidisoma sp.]HTI01014.1 sensor domain-containing diguanylate cyclase [Acidisoma sp.]